MQNETILIIYTYTIIEDETSATLRQGTHSSTFQREPSFVAFLEMA